MTLGFGGGTALTMMLDEYRLSTDIDFLCSDKQSYRRLREMFHDAQARAAFFGPGTQELREWKIDAYAIRGVVRVADSTPIKIEFVSEWRIDLDPFVPALAPHCHVKCLSQIDLFAEKLLANEDRGLDVSFNSRDIIDIAHMLQRWGAIPLRAWEKVDQAYGTNKNFMDRLKMSKDMLADPRYLARCMRVLDIAEERAAEILKELGVVPVEPDPDDLTPYLDRP